MLKRHAAARLCVQAFVALILTLVLAMLASYFGWHLVREAGGAIVS